MVIRIIWIGFWSCWSITDDRLDLKECEEILEEDHYGLEKVKERIIEYLAAIRQLAEKLKGPILCLIGPR